MCNKLETYPKTNFSYFFKWNFKPKITFIPHKIYLSGKIVQLEFHPIKNLLSSNFFICTQSNEEVKFHFVFDWIGNAWVDMKILQSDVTSLDSFNSSSLFCTHQNPQIHPSHCNFYHRHENFTNTQYNFSTLSQQMKWKANVMNSTKRHRVLCIYFCQE
jgi:hypothetical protein